MTKITMAHCSLQYSDTGQQKEADIEKLFKRAKEKNWGWITGTEAGPGAGKMGEYLAKYAKAAGYKTYIPSEQKGPGWATDCWVAVDKDLITKGSWKDHYWPVVPGRKALLPDVPKDAAKQFGPKGVVWVGFDAPDLGHISVAAMHYLTKAREKGSWGWKWNRRLARALGDWAEEEAEGSALCFYGGDQNMLDVSSDTFFGEHFTSAWDELGKYEATGHGNIDVIASYNKDARVKAKAVRALDDREFFLHGDHFLVEAVYEVGTLKK